MQTKYKITNKFSEEVIQKILEIKKNKGLTAEAIVTDARNKSSPLHDFFEWDNKKASEMWRIQQARIIINDVKVIVENKEYYAFENVSLTVEDKEPTREYFERSEILSNSDLRNQIIKRAFENLLYWKSKYEQYKEFSSIIKEIESYEKNRKVKVLV